MFKEYPHQNKILKNQPNIIVKSLSDKSILQKEFHVLSFLKNQSFTPAVSGFNGEYFLEQRLLGREMLRKDLTDKNIIKLALILRKIHLLKIPASIKNNINNDFLLNSVKYQPVLIMRTMLKDVPLVIAKKYKKILCTIAEDIESKLQTKKYQISLIHGDLSFHNIFFQNNKIFLIDWSDCRLDISSCDVSQLFYLLDFNQEQEKIFLKYYNMNYIDDQLLIFHKILLLLYDLAILAIKKQIPDKSHTLKLSLWSKKFYV